MKYKIVLLLLSVITLLQSCNNSNILKNTTPNIIILFADDLGYGDLSVYGHPTIRTPNLDAMAAKGMKFTNFYSGSPACTASRYALLTGRYPIRSGFQWVLYPNSSRGIHANEYTLAEGMKDAGYATACFGKWHLGTTKKEYLPLQNGFDEYFGLPYSNDMIPPLWNDITLIEGNDTISFNPDQKTLTKQYTDRTIDFITRHSRDPFFIYVPYAMPHLPLHPGEEFAGKSERGTYGDVVEELDWNVGRILNALKINNLSKNTLILFVSDNGPWIIKNEEGGSSGLLRDGKGSTWEGGMRVPMIAHWEGKISPANLNTQPTSTLDLYTSLLKLVGQEIPKETIYDGKDISNLFLGKSSEESVQQSYFFYGSKKLHAIRKGKWKLHIHTSSQTKRQYFDGKTPLLFNLNKDPSEQYDLTEQFPEVVNELLRDIEIHKNKIEAQPNFFQKERLASRKKHLAFEKSVILKNPPHPNYNSINTLTDGFIEGADRFQTLMGFEGNNLEAIIDLEKEKTIQEIKIGFLQNQPSWIFFPTKVDFFVSLNGKNFKKIATQEIDAELVNKMSGVFYFSTKEKMERKYRYLKVIANNQGKCPDNHDGAGKDCWIFADEIIVN
ncbi:MAG: sulfatase-like hydrolase/transferase [Saprospiraceae bacterium]